MRMHVNTANLQYEEDFSTAARNVLPGTEPVLRILLVEDHDDSRRSIERLLARWGHDVHSAANVTDAFNYASANEFDLLLSDIGLPDGTGIELLGKLRALHPLRAVAMSGFGEAADRAATQSAGFEAHLLKPVAMDRLKQIIDRPGGAR